YKQKYHAISIDNDFELSKENWLDLPILTRDEIQLTPTQFISNQIPPQHGQLNDINTSGSTGKSVQLKTTQITSLFWKVNTLRDHLWHKRDFRKSLAVIRLLNTKDISQIHQSDNWGPSTSAITQTGPLYSLDIRNTIKQQVLFLQQYQPDYLLTYPSNAKALAEYYEQKSLTPPDFSELRVFGESLSESSRMFCEKIFNTKLVDVYSCQEAGYLALQCPEHNHYHVQSESVYVEILNDHNLPCMPGEIGRVVISSLHNFATPIIRYELGDYAEVGNPCSCGRGLLVIKKILGRIRNMLTYPNGEKAWPVFGTKQFWDIARIKQFQFIQDSKDQITMNYVADKVLDSNAEMQLTKHIQTNLRYQFDIVFQFQKNISKSNTGKFEDFISKV
ncbi:MAG: phenylacetate--CoA ligase family protein, partial [Gammaproteobacteria bacterium]|nr:phenylacetate--CoA ligase family protein [Gammaproteobacteria bacterium]